MILYVEDLETEVSQIFIPTSKVHVSYLRPHLYIKNLPAGSLKVQICTEDGTLISQSDPIEISSITDATYFHGYVRFQISAFLQVNSRYLFKVVGVSGYSFSESAFCGVVRDYDLQRYPRSEEITHPVYAALDFEAWSISYK
jgi:hypothetical protein